MLSQFDQFGEFTPDDAPMPVERGDLVDVLIDADTEIGAVGLVARGVVIACERVKQDGEPTTCDLVNFDGSHGVVVPADELDVAGLGQGVVALRAPYGVGVWVRLLTCP